MIKKNGKRIWQEKVAVKFITKSSLPVYIEPILCDNDDYTIFLHRLQPKLKSILFLLGGYYG